MSVETATYISELDSAKPAGTDLKSEGDDHLRLIKAALENTFTEITGAITSTQDELNQLTGAHVTTTELNHLAGYCSVEPETNTTSALCEALDPSGTWYPATTSQVQTQLDTLTAGKAGLIDAEFAGTVEVGYCATVDGALLTSFKTSTDCTDDDATNVWSTNDVVQTGVTHDFASTQYSTSIDTTTTQTTSVDLSTGNVQIITLDSNTTGYCSINPSTNISEGLCDLESGAVWYEGKAPLDVTGMVNGGCYTFLIKNTGAFDIDFDSKFRFSGGPSAITSGSGKTDLVSCVSDGAALYCSVNFDLI
jgi:hypothetical protein